MSDDTEVANFVHILKKLDKINNSCIITSQTAIIEKMYIIHK